jgi:hypothetical protein
VAKFLNPFLGERVTMLLGHHTDLGEAVTLSEIFIFISRPFIREPALIHTIYRQFYFVWNRYQT